MSDWRGTNGTALKHLAEMFEAITFECPDCGKFNNLPIEDTGEQYRNALSWVCSDDDCCAEVVLMRLRPLSDESGPGGKR